MQQTLIDPSTGGFEWLDVTNPTVDELDAIARRYGLLEAAVEDCLEPDHLPKYELMGQVHFLITRIYNPKKDTRAITIRDLSSKIAIFYTRNFLITVHRLPQPALNRIQEAARESNVCPTTNELALQITRAVLDSYIDPGLTLADEMEEYEDSIFLKDKVPDTVLRNLYHLKRRMASVRRILLLTRDVINAVGRASDVPSAVQDTQDLETKALTLYEQLEDAVTHLIEIFISLQAQRADEVMRVLTVFSAFFLPLTFIVGIYGMNFQHMPELAWRYGYPACMGGMIVVVIGVYTWFKRRGWL